MDSKKTLKPPPPRTRVKTTTKKKPPPKKMSMKSIKSFAEDTLKGISGLRHIEKITKLRPQTRQHVKNELHNPINDFNSLKGIKQNNKIKKSLRGQGYLTDEQQKKRIKVMKVLKQKRKQKQKSQTPKGEGLKI